LDVSDEICIIAHADADVICCETVINPVEMFHHITAAAAATGADDDEDEDIKFIFTIRLSQSQIIFSARNSLSDEIGRGKGEVDLYCA